MNRDLYSSNNGNIDRSGTFDYQFADHPLNKNYLDKEMKSELYKKLAHNEAMRLFRKNTLKDIKRFFGIMNK